MIVAARNVEISYATKRKKEKIYKLYIKYKVNMASEAVIIELLGKDGDPIRMTVSNAATIEKGTILKLSDPRTAAASSADGDKPAGIAAAEKVALDGSTTLAVYTNGIFDLTEANSATITAGNMVTIGGANLIKLAAAGESETGDIIGRALEDFAKQEVAAVRVLI